MHINTRSSQKATESLPPVSPVVHAIGCIRHLPEFCDAWYTADDIATILTKTFHLSDTQALLLTPGLVNKEIKYDPATANVDTAPPNEIGIYRRRCTKGSEKSLLYFYYVSSQYGVAPPSTISNAWKHDVRSLVLSHQVTWPQGQKHRLEESRQRLQNFLDH